MFSAEVGIGTIGKTGAEHSRIEVDIRVSSVSETKLPEILTLFNPSTSIE